MSQIALMAVLPDLPVVAPELLLLGCAALVLIADLRLGPRRRAAVFLFTLVALLAVAALAAVPLVSGKTRYAYGAMVLSDPMAAVLKLMAILITALTLIYARSYALPRALWRGEFFALILFVLLGVMAMISANHLLIIYLGLELQALALYGLVALRRDDRAAVEAAMKYFVLGALASGFLLYGMSMLYGATGTLDINALAHRIASGQALHSVLVLGTVFIVAALAFKLGVVPFHMWVPDVYDGAPTPVALLLSAAPKFGAFAISFRLLVEGLPQLAVDWQHMLAVIALASIAVGNVTAVAQTKIKRMLGYSTVGQMGFMLLALLAGVVGGNLSITAGAYGAAMFYVLTYALASAGCFGVVLLASRAGFDADQIADLRGLGRRSPWYALVMTLLLLSLAGLPPTVGFTAKLVVLRALVSDGGSALMYRIAVVAVLLSVVGAFYYLRVVKVMWFDEAVDTQPLEGAADMRWALSINGAAILLLGVFPQALLALCDGVVLRALGG